MNNIKKKIKNLIITQFIDELFFLFSIIYIIYLISFKPNDYIFISIMSLLALLFMFIDSYVEKKIVNWNKMKNTLLLYIK